MQQLVCAQWEEPQHAEWKGFVSFSFKNEKSENWNSEWAVTTMSHSVNALQNHLEDHRQTVEKYCSSTCGYHPHETQKLINKIKLIHWHNTLGKTLPQLSTESVPGEWLIGRRGIITIVEATSYAHHAFLLSNNRPDIQEQI